MSDLAWAAGIVDGEGCIRLSKRLNNNRPSYTLIVRVSMTHEETIRRLRRIMGCGADYSEEGANKRAYIVQWNGVEAYKVLVQLFPYIFTKRLEAELGIEYWEKCSGVFNGCGVPRDIDILREIIHDELKEAKR